MRGELDRSALHRALQEVVRRHEVLRTTIDTAATGDSEAVQVIRPAVEIELPVRDLGPAGVDRVARDFARTPFDLGRGPLLRACLLRVAADEHVLLVGMHHIVSDGWSAGVLLGELAALYAAFVAGEPSPLPPLAVQYADYAVWQRARQDGEAIAADLAYWKQTLAGVPMLDLPTDRRRAAVQGQSGAREPVRIDGALTERLRRLCRETGVTTYMALHAALVALLHRYSGQTDLAVGTAVAGRNQPETEQLVGCFINTVVVRTDLAGDPTLRELLGRVKAAVLGAVAHQELQFERLVDELRVPRALRHAPLVQAMFVLHNTPSPRVRLGELTLEAIDIDSGTAKLDLVLELREEDGAIAGAWEYNTGLFDAETIRRLTGHLLALLTAATASPDRTLSSLSALDGRERDRVLALSAGPELPEDAEPASATVVAAFEAQAARTPRAPAAADTGQAVTFGELDERANAIAHGLRDIGVGPGERVAVLVGRPVEAITAMLGVLKAGGAYVPVDANAPPARRRALIEQAGARTVTDWAALAAGRTATRPEPLAGPADPAYVIFTSGSTGRPKGVVVEHGQLLWSTRARRAHYGPPGACLNLYALTFDGSVAWIWFALLAGGTVWCPPPGLVAEPSHLAEFVATHRLARIATVPALYGQLLAAAAPGQLRSLRSVTVGGEACPPELVRAHSSALPGVELHNEYGPTEATVWSTVWSSTPHDQPPFEATVPIGRPIPGGRSYVLDAHGALLPAGAAGELYVGGPAVARGYLDDPEQTRQRFRPDPFGRNGERVYRTGDRARWNRHGQLEFLGRTDRQLKVRGFRVEPAEIEAVLAAHPAVAEAVVIGATVDGSPDRLAGYVVPAAGATVDPDELTGFARSRLPGHLVPARLVTLSELPRTRHGKLDVRALPAAEPPPALAPVAPRTELERTLAAVVADTLRRDSVGVHDDFFELGGDSILAMSVVNRARQRGVELAVRQLFEHPTVARLAAVARTAGPPAPGAAGTIAGPVPLSPIQRWFFELDLPRPDHFNLSVQLELSMRPRPDVLRDALRAVLDHHAALRLRFSRRGGRWSQELSEASSDPALETARGPVDLVALDQRLQESLDLENGPLLRAALVQRGPQLPDRLLLVAHHLVVDAVSLRILLTDLFTAYGQLAAGRPAALPRDQSASYADWSRGLAEFAAGDAGRAQLDFWASQPYHLAPRLPRDGDGPNVASASDIVRVELDERDTRAVLAGARGVDVHAAVVGAVAGALAGWTGGGHIQLDIERHGREELVPGLDVSRTVGWFSDFHPVVLAVPGAGVLPAVAEQLRRVPGRGAGYVPLRYPAGGSLSAVPRSEVAVNYLGQLDLALPAEAPARVIGDVLGSLRAASGERPYLLEVTAGVLDGRLWLVWTHTGGIHRPDTVRRLAAAAAAMLAGRPVSDRSFVSGSDQFE
ncbi:MAG TPA: amino acid adenylation domain-containing protein, partial [Pseudonocardiaceae bacterium]|nr:amino acid adenylation domain-containing protein [Pseudonocardiaceae bacterium]